MSEASTRHARRRCRPPGWYADPWRVTQLALVGRRRLDRLHGPVVRPPAAGYVPSPPAVVDESGRSVRDGPRSSAWSSGVALSSSCTWCCMCSASRATTRSRARSRSRSVDRPPRRVRGRGAAARHRSAPRPRPPVPLGRPAARRSASASRRSIGVGMIAASRSRRIGIEPHRESLARARCTADALDGRGRALHRGRRRAVRGGAVLPRPRSMSGLVARFGRRARHHLPGRSCSASCTSARPTRVATSACSCSSRRSARCSASCGSASSGSAPGCSRTPRTTRSSSRSRSPLSRTSLAACTRAGRDRAVARLVVAPGRELRAELVVRRAPGSPRSRVQRRVPRRRRRTS